MIDAKTCEVDKHGNIIDATPNLAFNIIMASAFLCAVLIIIFMVVHPL